MRRNVIAIELSCKKGYALGTTIVGGSKNGHE